MALLTPVALFGGLCYHLLAGLTHRLWRFGQIRTDYTVYCRLLLVPQHTRGILISSKPRLANGFARARSTPFSGLPPLRSSFQEVCAKALSPSTVYWPSEAADSESVCSKFELTFAQETPHSSTVPSSSCLYTHDHLLTLG